jgi:hypothetical protein
VHAAALAGILMHLRRDRRMAATRATAPPGH